MLACEAAGGQFEDALPAAVAVELTHAFSLIHDDIQDRDLVRRGRPTVWKIWGEAQGINAGDLMGALANLILAENAAGLPHEVVLDSVATLDRAAMRMIEGQYLDLSFEDRADVSVEDYLEMVAGKTGALFGCALEVGAVAARADEPTRASFRRCGQDLGLAFQMHDDILGVWGDHTRTGKSAENDILRRKRTLLLIYALSNADERGRALLLRSYFVDTETEPPVDEIRHIFEGSGARKFVDDLSRERLSSAFAALEGVSLHEPAGADLRIVAEYLLSRSH
jgi:geranylgeranyl diphosphate synthase type I